MEMQNECHDLESVASDALWFGCAYLCKMCFPAMTANKLNLKLGPQITVLQSAKSAF